jgi:hypothetical protein
MSSNYASQIEGVTRIFKEPGKLRGVVLYTDAKYVRRHYGAQALGDAEAITAELGHPICYDSIKTMAWYPAVLRGISLLAIAKALDFQADDLRQMGWAAPRNSIITKLMMRYFASLRMLVDKLPAYWRRNYTVGSLTGQMYDHSVQLRLEGLDIPQELFPYLEGYFTSVVSMVIGNDGNISMTNIDRIDGDNACYKLVIRWGKNS